MKVYVHKDSKVRDICDIIEERYYSVEYLKSLPDNTVQVIPIKYDDTYFLDYIKESNATIVLENLVEGGDTFVRMLDNQGLLKGALEGRYATISTGELPESINNFNTNYMMYKTAEVNEHNKHVAYSRHERDYDFLFLNNRPRTHRIELINQLEQEGLLDNALWTHITEGRRLPRHYEKNDITFESLIDWKRWDAGECITQQYFDTYFSLQAESSVLHRYSMFTEKTWKPIIANHNWITLGSANHYEDLRKLGYEVPDWEWTSRDDWQDRLKGCIEQIKIQKEYGLHQWDLDTRPERRHNQDVFWKQYDEYYWTTREQLYDWFSLLGGQV
jgi:hypothetical protein